MRTLAAVERALLILEYLDSSQRGLNISEIGRKLEIPKSSAHVIGVTLERLGYLALRELGKLERTFFTLQWLQDPELRRRSHVGLNKGEQQNALRRAVFFNRLGEIRDRSYENQIHRASGLNLLVAAIILWNKTYLQRAVDHLRDQGQHPAPGDLAHLSPLGWEHINLTGDYHWETSSTLGPDQFRPLRIPAHDFAAAA